MSEPTFLDVSTDLRRCIYASFTKDKFTDKECVHFYNEALKNLSRVNTGKTTKDIRLAIDLIKNSKKHTIDKRRDDLLTASILLKLT